jgi:hypothetical protein
VHGLIIVTPHPTESVLKAPRTFMPRDAQIYARLLDKSHQRGGEAGLESVLRTPVGDVESG